MVLRKSFPVFLVMVFAIGHNYAQTLRQYRVIQNGDTLYTAELPEVVIKTSLSAYQVNYARTKPIVIKSIALANYIRDLSRELDENVALMDKRKDRRKYLKKEKQKLFDTFSDIVRDMSEREGHVFNKLVYRQAGVTTYTIIEKFLGPGKAFMWQTVSRVGGANLKETYDPYYRDKVIEDIMKQVDAGKIKIPRLPRNVEEYNKPVYE